MAGDNAPPLTSSRTSGRRNPMRQPQFIRSNTFRWALAVAGVFAVFVIVLFGFIYWQIDDYLIARSDSMITWQLDFIAGLPAERRLEAIDEKLKQDPRGVQYAGLFDADGRRISRQYREQLPPELQDRTIPSQSVPIDQDASDRTGEHQRDPRDRPAHAKRRRAGDRTQCRRGQGDLPCRRSGARAGSVAGAFCFACWPARG